MTRRDVVVLATFALVLGCRTASGSGPARSPEPPPIAVEVVTIGTDPIDGTVRRAAIVEPARRTVLGARSMSRAVAVPVAIGSRVEAGDPLVVLDVRDLRARRGQVLASRSAAEAAATLAETELGRATALHRGGALAAASYDSALASRTMRAADLDGGGAMLRELDVHLGEGTIRAPFAGIVVAKHVELGQLTTPGAPLIVLEDERQLRLVTSIAESDVESLRLGASYPARFPGEREATAVLDAIVPSGDPRAPGLTAIFVVASPDASLRTGVVASVAIPSSRGTPTGVRVPSSALVRRGGLVGVFVARDGRAHRVWVSIDEDQGEDTVVVLDALVAGDRVIRNASDPELDDLRRIVVAR